MKRLLILMAAGLGISAALIFVIGAFAPSPSDQDIAETAQPRGETAPAAADPTASDPTASDIETAAAGSSAPKGPAAPAGKVPPAPALSASGAPAAPAPSDLSAPAAPGPRAPNLAGAVDDTAPASDLAALAAPSARTDRLSAPSSALEPVAPPAAPSAPAAARGATRPAQVEAPSEGQSTPSVLLAHAGHDPEMLSAIEAARAKLDTFFDLAANQPEGMTNFGLRVAIATGQQVEYMWLEACKRLGSGAVSCVLNSDAEHADLQAGDRYEFSPNDITDWRYRHEGQVHGAYTTRVTLSRMPVRNLEEIQAGFAPLED